MRETKPSACSVCCIGMMSTSGKVLSEKVDVLRMTFYTAPISCIALAPAFYMHEVMLITRCKSSHTSQTPDIV